MNSWLTHLKLTATAKVSFTAMLIGIAAVVPSLASTDPAPAVTTAPPFDYCSGAQWLVTLDVTPPDAGSANLNRALSFSTADKTFTYPDPADKTKTKTGSICDALNSLKSDKGCKGEALQFIANQGYATKTSKRWYSHKSDKLRVLLFYTGASPHLSLDEAPRSTQIEADLSSLLQSFLGKGKALENIVCDSSDYSLQHERATLTVSADLASATTTPSTQSSQAQPAGTAGQGTKPSSNSTTGAKSAGGQAVITTGPREHLYLSGDVAVNRLSELQFDQSSHELVPKDKPQRFLIGFNYLLGDIFAEPRDAWWQGFAVKVFAEASGTPQNSIGAGLGYRLAPVTFLSLSLDSFSPFVAAIRTTDDTVTSSGAQGRGRTRMKFAWGISLNLDKALGWLKTSGTKASS